MSFLDVEGTQIIDLADNFNNNCAHFAARNGHRHILEFLKDVGFSKFNQKEARFDLTPLTLALLMKHYKCAEFLCNHVDPEGLNRGLLLIAQEGWKYMSLITEKISLR